VYKKVVLRHLELPVALTFTYLER